MCRLPSTRISTLALDDNEIGKDGGFKLASVLGASSVTKLHLSGNYLGAEGAGKYSVLPMRYAFCPLLQLAVVVTLLCLSALSISVSLLAHPCVVNFNHSLSA